MERFRGTPARMTIAGLAALGLMQQPRAWAQQVTPGFAPPTPITFIEVYRETKKLHLATGAVPEVEVNELRTKYVLRKTATGYSVVVTPVVTRRVDASGTSASILQGVLSNAVLTYDLDNTGTLVGVRGATEGFRELDKMIPREMVDALLAAIGQAGKTPEQLAADAWNARNLLGFLAGNTVVADGVLRSSAQRVESPMAGEINATVSVQVSRNQGCGSSCIEFIQITKSRDPVLGERLGPTFRAIFASAIPSVVRELKKGGNKLTATNPEKLIPTFRYSNVTTSAHLLRQFDAVTGLPRADASTMTFEADLSVAGDTLTHASVEVQKTSIFQYSR